MQSISTTIRDGAQRLWNRRILLSLLSLLAFAGVATSTAWAQGHDGGAAHHPGGEANLKLPNLSQVKFFGGLDGHTLLLLGIVVSILGLLFGLMIYANLKKMPVHQAMRDVSELIYETCKTYLVTQSTFILVLGPFIAVIIILYLGVLSPVPGKPLGVTLPIIILFSLVGIAGSYGVAWFGIRVNTFANSRTAFASLEGRPYPI